MAYNPDAPNRISLLNSTATLLASGSIFTGTSEDVSAYNSVIIAVKTDQNGTLAVQFSNDGSNWDSTLTKYYRTTQIEPPHRYTITRKYCRVVFTNTTSTNQTYLRLQTTFGNKTQLNVPMDVAMSQDYDAFAVRPSDYRHEVALGLRQGSNVWNKFGYNVDVDTGTPEIISSWGGTFSPLTTASKLSITSTTGSDISPNGSGSRSLVIYGVDENRQAQTEVLAMNGTTPVTSSGTWLGVNRIAISSAGDSQINNGTITAIASNDSSIQGQIPIGEGTTQQCIFFTQASHQGLAEWLTVNVIRFGSGLEPVVTIKGWVYSAISNAKYEVLRLNINTSLTDYEELKPTIPFQFTESSVFWLEATTTRDGTSVSARFSLIETRDVDS